MLLFLAQLIKTEFLRVPKQTRKSTDPSASYLAWILDASGKKSCDTVIVGTTYPKTHGREQLRVKIILSFL